jgi:hypothetical protein
MWERLISSVVRGDYNIIAPHTTDDINLSHIIVPLTTEDIILSHIIIPSYNR